MSRSKRSMPVSPEEFDAWIQEALAELPARFAKLADEVSIVVEEEPSVDILQDLELDSEDDLLGEERHEDQGECEPDERGDAVEIVELAQIVEEHLSDHDDQKAE